MAHTQEQIDNAFENLPEKLKTAVVSVGNFEILKSIRSEYQLSEEQAGEMGSETGLVVMGLTKPEQFVTNLAERLKIDPNKAREIGQKINERIFRPIRDDILNLGKPKPPVPPPAPQKNALHSTIDTGRMTGGAPLPEMPKMKSLDADLLSSVGAIKPTPPPPPEKRQPLDEALQNTLTKKATGRGAMAMVDDGKQTGKIPTDEELEKIEKNIGKEMAENMEKQAGKEISELEKELGGESSKQETGSFSFSRGFIGNEEASADLAREDILKAIENPGQLRRDLTADIKEPLRPIRTMETDKKAVTEERPTNGESTPDAPKKYEQDPYREPAQ